MSQNEENGTTKIRIELNRDAELERLQNERDKYKEQMVQVAAIDFAKQCQKYNLDPATSTPEQLENKKAEQSFSHSAPRGGDTAPLSGNFEQHTFYNVDDETVPLSWMTFESEPEMYAKIAERARKGDKEAKEIEAQLAKKAFSQNWEIEYNGKSMKPLYKDYLPITDNLPAEERQRRISYNKKLREEKANWRVV